MTPYAIGKWSFFNNPNHAFNHIAFNGLLVSYLEYLISDFASDIGFALYYWIVDIFYINENEYNHVIGFVIVV